MSTKTWIWIIIIVIIVVALFVVPKLNDPTRAMVKEWNAQGIDCLPQGHANLGQHFHPDIEIFVDDKPEHLPANAGIVRRCMAEVHTHDRSGRIHAESVLSGKEFTLSDLFVVWTDKTLEREGFDLEMTVDDELNTEFGDLILRDKQEIVLKYVSK